MTLRLPVRNLLRISIVFSGFVANTASAQGALTLGDAARMAARQNGAVEVARARVGESSARLSQARSALYPEVSGYVQQLQRTTNTATFGFAFRDATTGKYLFDPNGQLLGPIPQADARVRASASLYDFSARAKVNVAKSAVRASETEVTGAAELAAATAALAYIRVVRADAQRAALLADSTLAADLVRIARDQLQAGVGIALDVTRAESQAANVRALLIGARNNANRARLELRGALNLAPDAPLVLADSLGSLSIDSTAAMDESGIVSKALDSRADLRTLRAQQEAQKLQISAIRAERLPSLAAVADQGALGKDWAHPIATYTWSLQLSVPIFDGFRRNARIEEQTAVSREYDARDRDLRTQATLEVRSALLDLTATREQAAAVTERVRFAEQEVAQAQERFRAGVAGNSDVIAALLSLNQARTLRNDALASYQTARVSLARATGSLQQFR
jgi:outer membrane protein